MTSRISITGRVSRVLLLTAALLQFGASAAEPWAHLDVTVPGSAAEAPAGERDGDPERAPHDQDHCVVCHSLHGGSLPSHAPELPQPPLRAAIEQSRAVVTPTLARPTSDQARAPPAA